MVNTRFIKRVLILGYYVRESPTMTWLLWGKCSTGRA
jgi:hypothetical protein